MTGRCPVCRRSWPTSKRKPALLYPLRGGAAVLAARGGHVRLMPLENALIVALMQNRGAPPERLIIAIWPNPPLTVAKALDVTICRTRLKIERFGISIVNLGYRQGWCLAPPNAIELAA